jgi:16S rRNA (cytosine967-C5)-methyltransferase
MVCAPMHVKLSPARIWAANAITAILDHGQSMDDFLAGPNGFTAMSPRDRALARAIAGTVLRRLGQVDAILALYVAKPLPPKSGLMRAILRCATAEILFLRSPAFAIVSEAVSMAASKGKTRAFRHLANAVLRKMSAEGPERLKDIPATLNIPDWLRQNWQETYSEATVEKAAKVLIEDQPTDLTVFRDPAIWAENLSGTTIGGPSLRIAPADRQAGDITKWAGFEEGTWQVQDVAAALPALILNAGADENIIDLCAAPGGKTAQLAASGAKVIAVERSSSRLERLDRNMARLGLNVQSVCADALQWKPETLADAVLLDAPCTATGVFRRHPDVLALKTAEQVSDMANTQFAILTAAANMLRPGGRLIYCVCSAQTEEGEDIARRALKELPLDPLTIEIGALSYVQAFANENELRIPPGAWADKGGLDAFYIAAFTRQ